MLGNLRWVSAYLFFCVFGLSAQAQIQFSIEKGNSSSEMVLSGVVDYGAVLSPAHAFKNSLQDKLNAAFKCGDAGSFKCDEYPVGRLIGEKKFLMLEEEKDVWKHPVVHYTDQKQDRAMEIPIEISRSFPDAKIGDFKLLNVSTPGAGVREFEVQPKTLGDTMVKIIPARNTLYTQICQVLPGASLLNNHFSGTYTYLYKKLFRKTIDLGVDFEGHLGGASFDAIKICSLTKTEVQNNMNITSVLDIQPPIAYNLKRVPVEIEISKESWLILVLIALVLAAILVMIPAAIFKVLAVLAVVLAAAIAAIGSMSSSLATKYANKKVDEAIEQYLGVKVADFNSEVWAKKLKYDDLPFFKEDNVKEGDFKDGTWAAAYMTKKLLKDHQLLAQVSVNLALEKYFGQYSLPTADSLRPLCESLEKRILDRAKGVSLPKDELDSIAKLSARVKNICQNINMNVKMEMFIPMDKSRNVGCYDSFARLEEVQDRKNEVLTYLASKLTNTPGATFTSVVKDAVKDRLADFSIVQATNWWAHQDADKFCGFDNRLTVSYSLPEEARFAACFIKELKADHDISGGVSTLIDRIDSNCKLELRALGGGTK